MLQCQKTASPITSSRFRITWNQARTQYCVLAWFSGWKLLCFGGPRRMLKLTHQGAAPNRGRSLISTIALFVLLCRRRTSAARGDEPRRTCAVVRLTTTTGQRQQPIGSSRSRQVRVAMATGRAGARCSRAGRWTRWRRGSSDSRS